MSESLFKFVQGTKGFSFEPLKCKVLAQKVECIQTCYIVWTVTQPTSKGTVDNFFYPIKNLQRRVQGFLDNWNICIYKLIHVYGKPFNGIL